MRKNRFFLLMIMVIVLCFVSSTVISTVSLYQVLQKHALKNSEIIAAGIYNDINSRLLEPVIVANTLASDHFLIELLENEEEVDAEEISREMDAYTTSYMKNFSYRTVFVASEKTKAYYTYDGFYKIMDVADDVVMPRMHRPVSIDKNSLMIGYAGVYGSFLLHSLRAAEKFGVDARDILYEMGQRKTVGGQEDMILNVAYNLVQQRRRKA